MVLLADFRRSCCEIPASRCQCVGWYFTSETVKGLSLTLERIDDIHGYNILTAGMLSVGNTVTDEVLKEDLKDSDERDGG